MAERSINRLAIAILLLWCSSTSADQSDCITKLDKDVYIRPQNTKWSVDGYFSDGHVKLMEYIMQSSDQRWRFEPSTNIGFFNIVNKSTNKALDVGAYDAKDRSYSVTTGALVDSPSQQWVRNYDGTISNGLSNDYVLDVKDRKYTDRNYLVVTKRRGNSNTKFVLSLVNTDQYWPTE